MEENDALQMRSPWDQSHMGLVQKQGGNWGTQRISVWEDGGTLGNSRRITTPPLRVLLTSGQFIVNPGFRYYSLPFGVTSAVWSP